MEMIDKLQLGIVYDEKGKIINHRSLLKVILNPFLRIIGINIATKYNSHENKLFGISVVKCNRIQNISFLYENNNYKINRRRMLI